MFGHKYFTAYYFAPRYFPPSGTPGSVGFEGVQLIKKLGVIYSRMGVR